MTDFLPFLVLLIILAALLHEDTVLTIVYLVAGIYLVGQLWARKAMKSVIENRIFTQRAFPGETLNVSLTLRNTSWLPTPWLQIHDSLPVDMVSPNYYTRALFLGGHAQTTYQYSLFPKKRGYYQVGPLFLRSGDFFGLADDHERAGRSDALIVYPQIVPLSKLGLPTHSPFGPIRHTQPVYQDPSRVIGKREYQTGDSLRHVDWKSSAAGRDLLVKRFEPTISLETLLLLDLQNQSYPGKDHYNQVELAVTAAASIANWVIHEKQTAGLLTNGHDPFTTDGAPSLVSPRKGQAHLMRMLELLARIQTADGQTIFQAFDQQAARLPWGTTLVILTGQIGETFFDQTFPILRSGYNLSVVLVGKHPHLTDLARQAGAYGIDFHQVAYPSDLEDWGYSR